MPSLHWRWERPLRLLPRRPMMAVAAAALLAAAPFWSGAPSETAEAAPAPPLRASSYYMRTVNTMTLYNMGCALGERDKDVAGTQDSIVVLAYGMPRQVNGVYGASNFSNTFVSTAQIAAAAQQFGKGYYDCTGPDLASHLRLAVGTSNFGGQVTAGHGRAWAEMVNEVQAWFLRNGYTSQVDAAAANDMESGFNTPGATRAWLSGYSSGQWRVLYDVGDAAGCPPYGNCSSTAFAGWNVEETWFKSWGSPPVVPLPEIYTPSGSMAKQWQSLSLYSLTNHGQRMSIAGVMTQSQACRQGRACAGTNNTPATGRTQLWNALNADPRTAQELRWSTDIKWQ